MAGSTEARGTCVSCAGSLAHDRPYRFKSAVFRRSFRGSDVMRCTTCDLRQVDVGLVDDAALTNYYRSDYRSVARIGGGDAMFIYRPRAQGLAALARQVAGDTVERIFEVGAGHGINLAALGEAYPTARLFTDEIDETVHLPDRIAQASLADGPFDIVLMSHVLEHFADPLAVLEQAADALSPQGILLIEVPNDTPGEMAVQAHHEPHLTFFEQPTLRSLVERKLRVVDEFQVGTPPREPGRQGGRLIKAVKDLAKKTPVLKTILDARRDRIQLDLTTRQVSGAYLRLVARRR